MLALIKISLKYLVPLSIIFAFTPCAVSSDISGQEKKNRPYYEYPGNYREQINRLKTNFKEKFGYKLIDLEKEWTPDEIAIMHATFSQLPDSFYQLQGLTGFYRRDNFKASVGDMDAGDIPAATWPKFRSVYRNSLKSHVVEINEEALRIEFYNPLFNETREVLTNIIQHEMGHVFDLANGFLSFKKEWLELSRFRIINFPALDAQPGDDFLFVMTSDPGEKKYAPVSTRHISTYSRENPQEDFANSVSAYIHYPYFRYSHPKRFAFIKKNVFHGKEYFPIDKSAGSYREKALNDLQKALQQNNWEEVIHIALETSRSQTPEIELEITEALRNATSKDLSPGEYLKAVHASCYINNSEGLKFRRDLALRRKVSVPDVLKIERCFRMGTKVFEEKLSKWPMTKLIFYREEKRDSIQFIDQALLTAHSRGFSTSYVWKITLADTPGKTVTQGKSPAKEPVTGAVKIDLTMNAGQGSSLPEGKKLILELSAERTRPEPFKIFKSSLARIQFVIYPWFNYQGPSPPAIQINYHNKTKR